MQYHKICTKSKWNIWCKRIWNKRYWLAMILSGYSLRFASGLLPLASFFLKVRFQSSLTSSLKLTLYCPPLLRLRRVQLQDLYLVYLWSFFFYSSVNGVGVIVIFKVKNGSKVSQIFQLSGVEQFLRLILYCIGPNRTNLVLKYVRRRFIAQLTSFIILSQPDSKNYIANTDILTLVVEG